MQIYIRRNNEDFGPYSREALQEYVKHGIFSAGDSAAYVGTSELKTVSELLGLGGASETSGAGKGKRPTQRGVATQTPSTGPVSRKAARMRRGYRPAVSKKKGYMIVLNVFLILVVAAAAYVRFGGGGPTAHRYLAAVTAAVAREINNANANPESSPTPAPATVAGATPSVHEPVAAVPVKDTEPAVPAVDKAAAATEPSATTAAPVAVAAAAATPAPAVASTPAPTKPFDPADLAGNPAAWPKTVKLKQAITFPAVLDSQVVGNVTVPAGTLVKLVNVRGDQLTLEHNGATQDVSWRLTDIEEQVATGGSLAPAAPRATEAAAGTNSAPPDGN